MGNAEYMRASNWAEDKHEIKLVYMRVCLSEEIIQATNFDDKHSVHQGMTEVNNFLERSIRPLLLQRLEVLRISNTGGESQEQITQHMMENFRNARMFEIDGERLCKLLLVNTIQKNADMKEVLRSMRAENPDSTQLKQMIMDTAALNNLTPEFMPTGGRTPQISVAQSPAIKKHK